jgi:hypothetical protein
MKFEKFFKAVGTHGLIVKRSEVESWLVCGGVGMKIPDGVNNLGISQAPDAMFKAIIHSETSDDLLVLKEAILHDPEGKAADIIRVFESELGDRVGIYNGSYGLLEKKDLLTYLEIEDDSQEDDVKTCKYIVVLDHSKNIVGFIKGSDEI